MDAELLDTLSLEPLEGLKKLGLGHAVLGISGIVHDICPQGEDSARIEAAADPLRNPAGLFQKINVGDVIQINDGIQLLGQQVFLCRRLVGGKHDGAAIGKAAAVAHYQLCKRGAVHPAALFLQDLQDGRSGGCLHRKKLLKPFIPGKCLVQIAGGLPDSLLVIKMEWSGVFFYN